MIHFFHCTGSVGFLWRIFRDVDYSVFLKPETRAVVFGETHLSKLSKAEIANNLQQLKQLGLTHIGMEFIPSTNQQVVDDYQNGVGNRNAVAGFFEDFGLQDNYISVIDAATASQIKVVGVDIPPEKRDEQRQTVYGSLDTLIDRDDLLGSLKRVLETHLANQKGPRDRHFAQVAKEILQQDSNFKIALFVGKEHASRDSNSMAGILADWGITTNSIVLEAEDEPTLKGSFLDITRSAKLSKDKFMVPGEIASKITGTTKNGLLLLPRADWVIHLPV